MNEVILNIHELIYVAHAGEKRANLEKFLSGTNKPKKKRKSF